MEKLRLFQRVLLVFAIVQTFAILWVSVSNSIGSKSDVIVENFISEFFIPE